jgi:hypothetical protein
VIIMCVDSSNKMSQLITPTGAGQVFSLNNSTPPIVLVDMAGWGGGNVVLKLPNPTTIAVGTTYRICSFNNIAFIGGHNVEVKTHDDVSIDRLGWLTLTNPGRYMNTYIMTNSGTFGSTKNRWCAFENQNGADRFLGGGYDA